MLVEMSCEARETDGDGGSQRCEFHEAMEEEVVLASMDRGDDEIEARVVSAEGGPAEERAVRLLRGDADKLRASGSRGGSTHVLSAACRFPLPFLSSTAASFRAGCSSSPKRIG